MSRHPALRHWLIGVGAALGLLLTAQVAAADPVDTQTDALFTAMDTDRDGKVSPAEHAAGARRLFDVMDVNRDGRVTAVEMDQARNAMNGGKADPKSMPAAGRIAIIDRNADGALSAEEHAAGARDTFATLDSNADGFLSRDELAQEQARLLNRVAR